MVMYKTICIKLRGKILVKNGFVLRTPPVYQYVVNTPGEQKYWSVLSLKISLFSVACIRTVGKLKQFLTDQVHEDKEVVDLLRSELLRVEFWLDQEGKQVFRDLSTRIRSNQSRIDDKTFLNIQDAFDNHYRITEDTFGRELTLSRCEMVLDYLKELPFIVKMELDFELPVMGNRVQKTKRINTEKVILETYTPTKSNAYSDVKPRKTA